MTTYIRELKYPMEVTINKYNLQVGAYLLGEEVKTYRSLHEIPVIKEEDLVVDYLYETRMILELMGVELNELDYPEVLKELFGRTIREGILGEIVNMPENWGQFVKPKLGTKSFTGRVVNGTKDLVGIGLPFDYPVWISEAVDFKREWRAYILNGEVLDVRPYKGDYHYTYNPSVIDEAVRLWTDAPAAYGLDIGVTSDGRTLLVEVNDGYALGNYGLSPIDAFKFQKARWAEMTASYFKENKTLVIPSDFFSEL
ncbi:hypothetical protein BAU15_06115 [Enterococcus sp. JM4C]|uniref:ATP-grasp domain-containing protein n=1 Tax=Candidatus Enterococcus huntleyi TaxID=1857217 RepID=UPI001379720B|nr:ATP-grasp domain-containing protein [Enterococcus sp. JM4C]KAF1297123.1 hypothetical protein BAU15_06115 [Enterococcus sp. JM4C]